MASFKLNPNWKREIESGLRAVLDDIGRDSVADAKRMAPYETGELRNSIEHEIDMENGELGTLRISSDVEHAIFQELGTADMRPQPFLRPSVLRKRG